MAVRITPSNCDDRAPVKSVQLTTGIRKNMKNYLMPLFDNFLLGIRNLLSKQPSINLNPQWGLSMTCYRSPINAFVHVISCLIAYSLGKNKPKIDASYP